MSGTVEEVVNAGTRFPFINLEKAIGRAQQLYAADQKGREMTVSGAFAAWEYSEKSSGGFQTVSALKEYGLLQSPASGKVQLTPEALRFFRDEREDERERLRMYFAHRPKLIQTLWERGQWGASPPADSIARSHLKTDIGLSEQSARSFLAIYKENIAFAGFKSDAKIDPVVNAHKGEMPPPNPPAQVKVGDYIQWTSLGIDQFKTPQRVEEILPGGTHLRVFGSMTGIPMTDVTIATAPVAPVTLPPVEKPIASSAWVKGENDFNVLQKGDRLEITANLDLAGIAEFKEVLGHYENILGILARRSQRN
jgi:hypothetical protein